MCVQSSESNLLSSFIQSILMDFFLRAYTSSKAEQPFARLCRSNSRNMKRKGKWSDYLNILFFMKHSERKSLNPSLNLLIECVLPRPRPHQTAIWSDLFSVSKWFYLTYSITFCYIWKSCAKIRCPWSMLHMFSSLVRSPLGGAEAVTFKDTKIMCWIIVI